MMKAIKIFLLCFLLISINSRGWSQTFELSLEQKSTVIDSMINVWCNHDMFNGGIVILKKGEVVYQRSAGYANFEKKTFNTNTSQFNLASISKPFTAIAILQLVNKKKLKLTDKFTQYFPDFPYTDVTITQLLSHTSGLPEADQFEKPFIASNPNEILSNQQIYDDLIKLNIQPLANPGEKHYYNNLNYILLALLIEKISKNSFPEYMRKNIFEKAGMRNTYVRQGNSPNTARYFRTTFYDTVYQHVDSVVNKKIYTDFPLGGTYGDNNIITTLNDMVLFDKALDNEILLPQSLIKTMYQPVKLANGESFFNGGKKTYTLGWNVNEQNDRGQFVAWHDGSLVGLTTIMFRNMTDGVTYIMYENRNYPGFFWRYLAVSNIIDDVEPINVSLSRSLIREAYGPALVTKGTEYATALFNSLKDNPGWYFDKYELNELGYHLLLKSDFEKHTKLAVEAFRLNAILFPDEANFLDSYAEGLMLLGFKEAAILMYQKTLSLNPNNESAEYNLRMLINELSY